MNKVNIAGVEFCTENNDFWYTIANWEPYSFAVLKQFSDKNKTFVDVGAWIGPLSLFASSSYKNVIAFEPDTKAFTELTNNIPYFLKCFQEDMDKIVFEAKLEVENAILHKIQSVGFNILQEQQKQIEI